MWPRKSGNHFDSIKYWDSQSVLWNDLSLRFVRISHSLKRDDPQADRRLIVDRQGQTCYLIEYVNDRESSSFWMCDRFSFWSRVLTYRVWIGEDEKSGFLSFNVRPGGGSKRG